MNKAEREVRQVLRLYPGIRLDSDGRGFVLIAPNRERLRIGALRGEHQNGVRRIKQWCEKHA